MTNKMTDKQRSDFQSAYSAIHFDPENDTTFYLDEEPFRKLYEIAELNKQNYASTNKNLPEDSEFNGLFGEDAFFRYMGVSAENACQKLENAKDSGDGGIDAEIGDLKIDVKTKKWSNDEPLFSLWKHNKNADKAEVWVFAVVQHDKKTGTCKLLGWAYRKEVEPLLHEEKREGTREGSQVKIKIVQDPNYWHLRLKDVKKAGLFRPMEELRNFLGGQ